MVWTVTDIATTVLAVITAIYVLITYLILRANQRTVAIMAEQVDAMSRPFVTVTAFLPPELIIFSLKIANTGKTAARNLKLTLDRDYYKYGKNTVGGNLAGYAAFNSVIESFAPGAELLFDLAEGFVVFGDNRDEQLNPMVFTITAEYSYGERRVTEQNTIDLRPYYMTNLPHDPLVSGVKELAKAIEKASDNITRAIK